MSRMPVALLGVVALVGAIASGPAAAGDETAISLSSIAARAAELRIGAIPLQAGPGAALAAVAGGETLPVACATPLLQFLGSADAPPAPALDLARLVAEAAPRLEAERTVAPAEANFLIHYSGAPRNGLLLTDRDRDGAPDAVDRLAEALVASESFLVSRLGYPSPAGPDDRLDVYFADIGRGIEGYAVPSRGRAGAAFLVLDAALPADRLMPAVFHQVAHASLLTLLPAAPRWWGEATAAWLGFAGTGDLRGPEAGVRARQGAAGRGLAADGLLIMQGSMLWPMFLAERTGDPGVVRRIWSEAAAHDGDPLAAADVVLSRTHGLTLAAATREFAAWNLFTGERDDGLHYATGRALPAAPLQAVGPGFPMDIDPVEPVESLGSVAFLLPGDGRRGMLQIDVSSSGGRPAADLLVRYRTEGALPVLVTVPLGSAGAGRVAIPWSDAREAWLILRNDAVGGEPARFSVRAAHDPYAPFDLASFTAQGFGRSIVLEWSTVSERGLAGWNIARSESPAGPFTRLDEVAIPAFGDGATDVGYLYVDETARPGRRYYYILEGLTEAGLLERSHVVSGRTVAGR